MAPTRLVKLAQTAGLIFALSQSVCFAQLEQDQIVSFTQLQAEQGKSVYEENCAACHGVNMAGVGVTPSLSGDNFASKCSGASLADLFTQLRRMPPENPAGLAEQSYQQILAYILQTNGVTSGTEPLVSKLDADESRTVPVMPESQSSATVIVQLDQHSRNLLNNLSAVSAEMLLNPSPNDWLLWHRTYDNQGFSPLQQINRDNVADLQLSWTFPLAIGENNPGPLIHDGVMFLFTYPDTVLAIDATNGALLWQYQHQSQTRSSQKKGVALHGNKVIVPTSDLHLLALNAKSGELIWDHEIAIEDGLSGYHLRSAPFIVGDIIMQGITAIRVPKGGFIVAVDVETGQESWRFNTIPGPGEPGGNSWNDLPLQERNGGSVWNQGSYDAELNLAFFGAAPTYDTGALLYPVEKDGITNDALYTNSTLALNPQTGELVWYYQHLANDQWDLDWAFERQIVELSSESMAGKGSGKATDKPTRKIVLTMGKPAILEAMDAATGEYLFSMDMGLQNVVLAIDPVTGYKTINPDTVPNLEQTRLICPSHFGSKSWPPSAFNPTTKRLYVPLNEGCMLAGPNGYSLLSSGVKMAYALHPDSEGNMGRVQALDLEQQQFAWQHRQKSPVISSLLATAGGLVFAGDMDRSLKAFDERTGEVLWQTTLGDVPSSLIVTYSVDGKQYVAVVVGQRNYHVTDWTRMYTLLAEEEGWTFDDSARQGAAIQVFSLD